MTSTRKPSSKKTSRNSGPAGPSFPAPPRTPGPHPQRLGVDRRRRPLGQLVDRPQLGVRHRFVGEGVGGACPTEQQ